MSGASHHDTSTHLPSDIQLPGFPHCYDMFGPIESHSSSMKPGESSADRSMPVICYHTHWLSSLAMEASFSLSHQHLLLSSSTLQNCAHSPYDSDVLSYFTLFLVSNCYDIHIKLYFLITAVEADSVFPILLNLLVLAC